jgi:hypothetical protein
VIKAVGWYTWNQVLPRLLSMFHWSSGLWVAIVTGAIFGYCGASFIPPTTTVGSVAMALLTYAAIALGFSLAGLTLVLTLPSVEFVNWLCGTMPAKKKFDSYSDLLFVFSWTAIIHWVIVFGSIGLVLLVNPNQVAFEAGKHRLWSGVVSGIGVYGLVQFLVTLITLAQLGFTYSLHLRAQLTQQKEDPADPKPVV